LVRLGEAGTAGNLRCRNYANTGHRSDFCSRRGRRRGDVFRQPQSFCWAPDPQSAWASADLRAAVLNMATYREHRIREQHATILPRWVLQILDEQKRYIQAAKGQPTEPHRFRTLAAQTENLRSANPGNRGRCCDPKTPTHTASTLAFCIERHHHTGGDGRGSLESPRCREGKGGGSTVPLDGRQALRALGPPDPRIDTFFSECYCDLPSGVRFAKQQS
jgi:hypothetical protein